MVAKSNLASKTQKYFDLEKEYQNELENLDRTFTFYDWVRIADEGKIKKHLKVDKQFSVIKKFSEDFEAKKIIFKPVLKESTHESFAVEDSIEKKPNVPELVSETLANVYLSQCLFSQAIRVLERLQLVNPQKKDYFAVRISEIKQKSIEISKKAVK